MADDLRVRAALGHRRGHRCHPRPAPSAGPSHQQEDTPRGVGDRRLTEHQGLRNRQQGHPGMDEAKRIIGRKRHLGCDTLGLLLTVLVTTASISDTAVGVTLLSRITAAHPGVRKAWVDAGYRTTAIDHGARLGIDVHPVQREPGTKGFKVIPRRWTIERSIGWLMTTAASPVATKGTRTAPKP
ncbi:transposase [Streptomyces bottropensis]|uniref:transposase n=1 Tax=Streptomyces bottropensis TaxID=42235 RepID=UPI0038244D64